MQEVLDNFVSNALKYTMKGNVEISWEEITDSKGLPQIKVNVKDSGIGIPEEDIAKLGRKFFRARQYISENQGDVDIKVSGTGLGLYVSFELVKIMGGEIKVTSKLGEGSTFSFTLPKYTGQEVKNIDQTFNNDEDLEQKLRAQLFNEGDNSTNKLAQDDESEESRNKFSTENEVQLKNNSTPMSYLPQTVNNDQKPSESATQKAGLRKLVSANDIMQKINEGRKYLEGDNHPSESDLSEAK